MSLYFGTSTRKEILPDVINFQQNSLRRSQDICSGNFLMNISSRLSVVSEQNSYFIIITIKLSCSVKAFGYLYYLKSIILPSLFRLSILFIWQCEENKDIKKWKCCKTSPSSECCFRGGIFLVKLNWSRIN